MCGPLLTSSPARVDDAFDGRVVEIESPTEAHAERRHARIHLGARLNCDHVAQIFIKQLGDAVGRGSVRIVEGKPARNVRYVELG